MKISGYWIFLGVRVAPMRRTRWKRVSQTHVLVLRLELWQLHVAARYDRQGDNAQEAVEQAEVDVPMPRALEDALIDAWDAADEADWSTVTKEVGPFSVNTQTPVGRWTPLMVACGLPKVIRSWHVARISGILVFQPRSPQSLALPIQPPPRHAPNASLISYNVSMEFDCLAWALWARHEFDVV